MVNKGKIRGNGAALATYVLTKGKNESVRIIDVDGMAKPNTQDLKNLLRDMSLNEQLTRSKQGIYHAIINPSPHDRELTDFEWLRAVEIMGQELGFDGQRSATILHRKDSRTHAHIAFERYKDGKMIAIDHNYRKHDKARARMEIEFGHTPTPQKNPRRGDMKTILTVLWQQTESATEFIKAARKEGLHIAKGQHRKPFLVVDAQRSFNLVRHLDNVTTKELRQRFNGSILMEEKDALALARTSSELTKSKKQTQEATQQQLPEQSQSHETKQSNRDTFMENLAATRLQQQRRKNGPHIK